MKKVILFFFMLISLVPSVLHAQPMKNALPPELRSLKTGVIKGTMVYAKSKRPLGNQPMALIAYQNGQRVLMLDKKTDPKGSFQFGNIFRDPSFKYAIGTFFEDGLYIFPNLSLGADEESRTVVFLVGEGSPYFVPTDHLEKNEESDSPQAAEPPIPSPSVFTLKGQNVYKNISLVLCGVVLLLAFYFWQKETKPS